MWVAQPEMASNLCKLLGGGLDPLAFLPLFLKFPPSTGTLIERDARKVGEELKRLAETDAAHFFDKRKFVAALSTIKAMPPAILFPGERVAITSPVQAAGVTACPFVWREPQLAE